MIKQLKRKFIMITMSLITVVLIAVFAAISVIHYNRLTNDSYRAMERIISGNFEHGFEKPRIDEKQERRDFQFAPIFSVNVDENGNIVSSTVDYVNISQETLKSAVDKVNKESDERGKISSLRLLYIRKVNSDGSMRIAFADQIHNRESLYLLMRNLLIVEIFALLVFLGVSIYLAEMALKPVEKAWENEKQFLGDASHELKTPLTVILTNLSILSSNSNLIDKSQLRWIKNSNDEALRMKELIEQMLFLAKYDSYQLPTIAEDINLSEVTMESILTMESIAFERNLTFKEEISNDLIITGNSSQIKQLINILLDNACKYAQEKTVITVNLKSEKGSIVFSVNNKGSFISQDEIDKLFDRFYRSEKSRVRKEGGYGLGLSIAKSIVKTHNGRIEVESNIDDGTTFRVIF